ncbi:MAG: hypothetical protein H0V01_07530 [Bacteroidetes bacterium]|nr:hypothetical protein [Bacteroidota bacterium]HET6244210.1 helix-turn-helix domain-containing protein [Bacteroidia bacterium]
MELINSPEKETEKLIKLVCNYFRLNPKILSSKTRKQEVVYCRALIFYFLVNDLKFTSIKAGQVFNRNHATVLHSINIVKSKLKKEKEYIIYLRDKIQGNTEILTKEIEVYKKENIVKYKINHERIERNKQIIKSYMAGKSIKEIAMKYRLTPEAIRLVIIREQGAKLFLVRKKTIKQLKKQEFEKSIIALFSKGNSAQELATKFNTSITTVRQIVSKVPDAKTLKDKNKLLKKLKKQTQ